MKTTYFNKQAAVRGVENGHIIDITLAINELITSVTVSTGDALCALTFRSSFKTYGPYTASKCKAYSTETQQMSSLFAFFGSAELSIAAIGFIYV